MTGTGGWSRLLAARWRQVLVGLAIGAAALVIALWGVDLQEVARAVAAARLPWLLPVAALFLLQQVLRAWRQAILVRAVAPRHRFRTSLSVLCVSFFLINALPARIGELSRPLLLLERDDVPLGAGFAVVFVERAVDLCAMFVMIALVAWLVPVPTRVLVVGGASIDWVELGRRAAGTAVPLILLVLVAVLVGGRALLGRLRQLGGRLGSPLARPLAVLLRLGGGFVDAVDGLRDPRRLAAVVVLTAASWAVTGWTYPALARAFDIGDKVGFGQGIGILAITMLGMTIPSAPGFAGTYEAFVRGALVLFGVSGPGAAGSPSLDAVAVAYTLTMHWWIFVVQASTAFFFLAVDRVDLRALGRRVRALDAAPD